MTTPFKEIELTKDTEFIRTYSRARDDDSSEYKITLPKGMKVLYSRFYNGFEFIHTARKVVDGVLYHSEVVIRK